MIIVLEEQAIKSSTLWVQESEQDILAVAATGQVKSHIIALTF